MTEYRKFSEQQIALVNQIDLAEYLRAQGELLLKSGKEFRWDRKTSVTIKGNKWYQHKAGIGGYPVQFLETFYNYNYREAVELLLSYANDTHIAVGTIQEAVQPETKEFKLPERNQDMRKIYAYLLKTRHIDKDVLNEFVKQGLIYEDAEYHNVVFVGVDEKGVPRHAHKKSTFTKAEGSYRGNVEGSDPRYSFHYKGSSDHLFVFEAPIDMLSYLSLHKENWQRHSYVALCGLGMQAMDTLLENDKKLQFIIFGTDHDVAGSEGVERMNDHLFEKGYSQIAVVQPTYKDFNEDLKASCGLAAQPAVENPNYEQLKTLMQDMKAHISSVEPIEHKALSKAFTDMYYGLNHEANNDFQKLKRDFLKITECALRLEHQNLYVDVPFSKTSPAFDNLQEDYRSYQDKGNLKKRIEAVKKAFQSIKLVMNAKTDKTEIGNAYRKLVNHSFMMVMETERERMKMEEQTNMQKKIRPKAPLIGSNGNIFNLMGIATHALKDAGMEKEAQDMFDKITSSHSYNEALEILMEYVEPIDVSEQQEQTYDHQIG